MTDELLTEEQEAERARQWLRENGMFIAAGVVLGLGGLFGWQQWQDYQETRAEQASAVWNQLRNAIEGERYNEVDETLSLLEDEYTGTPYVDQGHLAVAALEMDRNDPEAALVELQKVEQDGRDEQLRRVATLRRAQVLNSLGRYDEALTALGDTAWPGLAGLYHELRGDALFGKADYAAAADQYRQALNTDAGGVVDRSYVQMKLDDSLGSVVTTPEEPADSAAEPGES